jgi:stress response protein YsnF
MFGLFGPGPGEDPASFEPDLDRRRALADLQARVERRAGGWSVQLPLRAEVVRIEKQLVPYEQVVVRCRRTERIQQVDTMIRRERLVVGEHGQTVVESGYEPR